MQQCLVSQSKHAVAFSVLCLLLLSLTVADTSVLAYDKDNHKSNKTSRNEIESSTASSNSVSQAIPLPKDRFGVEMLYPTRLTGQEWFMNMANPTSDGRFNPQGHITKNSDGSWKMKSNKVRMYVNTIDGYNPDQLISNDGQSKAAGRGFMSTPQDWKDVEITGYVKLNEFSDNDNFVWYSRGGRHSESDNCQGSGYKGNLFYLGETQFSKEQWHVSYAKSPTATADSPLQGNWVGFKFVMYNFLQDGGGTAVKLENWVDKNADGKNWLKVYEGADAGKWGRAGEECSVRADQILSWGGPLVGFRWDFAPDVDFKYLSVREITGENGSTDGVTYFTGTSKSSNVQDITSSGDNELPLGSNTQLGDPSRHNLTDVGINRNPNTPSTNGGNTETTVEGDAFDFKTITAGEMMYVLWVSGDEDNTDVYLKISEDNGATFYKTINLSNNPASLSYNPQIVTLGQDVYIVWEDDAGNSGNSDVFYIKSSDGGRSFTSTKNLSDDPSGSGSPQLVASGNIVYVTWMGTSPDNTDILLVESSNNGDSFSEPKNLSRDPEISFNPKMSVNGTHVFVEWTNQDDAGVTTAKSTSLQQSVADHEGNLNAYTSLPDALNSTDLAGESGYSYLQNSTNPQTSGNSTGTNNALNQTIIVSAGTSSPPSSSHVSDSNSTTNVESTSSNNNSNSTTSNSISTSSSPEEQKQDNQTDKEITDTNYQNSTTTRAAQVNQLLDDPKLGSDKLEALSAAEEALRAREEQQRNKEVSLAEKPTSHIGSNNPADIMQQPSSSEQKEQEQLEEKDQVETQILASPPPLKDAAESLTTPENTERTDTKADVNVNEKQERKEQQEQQQQEQQTRSQEQESSLNDKNFASNPPSSTDLSTQSSKLQDRGGKEKETINREEERKQEQEGTILQKRNIINTDKLREQRHQNEAREIVQDLVREANEAKIKAGILVDEAEKANQRAESAAKEFNSLGQVEEESNGSSNQNYPKGLNDLINDAKIANQKAENAVEKYNDLRRAAEKAVKDFNKEYN